MVPQSRPKLWEDQAQTWKIVINPREYTKVQRKNVIEKGWEQFVSEESKSFEETEFLKEVGRFIHVSLERPTKQEVFNTYGKYENNPWKLVYLATMGSLIVQRNEIIQNDSREPRIQEYLYRYFRNEILHASLESDCKQTIRETMGKLVYGRDKEDDRGPPAGHVIEGIVEKGDELPYYKVPLVHASRYCEARDENDDLRVHIDGPYVFIPVDDIQEKFIDYFHNRENVPGHFEFLEGFFQEQQLKHYQERLESVNNQIERIDIANRDHMLFHERKYPSELKVILMAVEEADPGTAKLGEALTSKEILKAVEELAQVAEQDWVMSIAGDLDTTRGIGNKLTKYGKDSGIPQVTLKRYAEGYPNKYILRSTSDDCKLVDVAEMGDLLELPCMQNLHQTLQKTEPHRWALDSFVQFALGVDADITEDDIVDWFSQYPWFEKNVTEFQVNNLSEQMEITDLPFPINCNNDNQRWSEYCIGMENCEYRLDQSIEIDPDVYNLSDGGEDYNTLEEN